MDFLGYGLSDKPQRHVYSLVEQADLVEAVVAELRPRVTTFHILAHDVGAGVAQELLARGIDRHKAGVSFSSSVPSDSESTEERDLEASRPAIASVVLLNSGIIPGSHRPLITQRLLASKYTGPLLKRLIVNSLTFTRSLASVFGPDHKPSDLELGIHWALFAHKDGPGIIDRLLGYMEERKRQADRWTDALFETPVPVAVINGPDDPVSGAHLLAAYRALHHTRVKALRRREAAVDQAGSTSAGTGSKGGGSNVAADDRPHLAAVLAARSLDDAVSLGEGVGHYPHIEDPQGVLGAMQAFYAKIDLGSASGGNRPRAAGREGQARRGHGSGNGRAFAPTRALEVEAPIEGVAT